MTNIHLYKAGARIARTGGKDSRRTMVAWCVNNDLTDQENRSVVAGYSDEIKNGGRSRRLGLAMK